MTTAAERNQRLDALQQAATEWADKRTTELQNRVDSNKKILQGRTGADRLAQSAVAASSALVVSEIDDFLVVK